MKNTRKEYYKKWREKNKNHILEYQREYYKIYWNKYYEKNKDKILFRIRKWRKTVNGKKYIKNREILNKINTPEKIIARKICRNAVSSGVLIKKPCTCGELKVQGHHEDYSKPLEVVWLCRKCHNNYHIIH